MKVLVFLADGFEEIEAVTVIDVLRRAEVEVVTVSVMESTEVRGSHQISVRADILMNDVINEVIAEGIRNGSEEKTAMLVLPGGMPGTLNLDNNKQLMELILSFHEAGRYIAAICAAPVILGRAGVLKGRSATCYPGFEKELDGAVVTEERVVRDGNIITSRGAGTAMEFALKLVEILEGKQAAEKLYKGMLCT